MRDMGVVGLNGKRQLIHSSIYGGDDFYASRDVSVWFSKSEKSAKQIAGWPTEIPSLLHPS
jgi:hypothetical protein